MAETVKQPVTRLFYNICISFLITYKEIAINKTTTNLILRVPASHSQKHIVPSAPVEDKYLFEPLHSGENWKGEQGEKKTKRSILRQHSASQNNFLPSEQPSWVAWKALWLLLPHSPNCTISSNSKQEAEQTVQQWLQFLLTILVLRITVCKAIILHNRTVHMHHAILRNFLVYFSLPQIDYAWHFAMIRYCDNKCVIFATSTMKMSSSFTA